MIHNKQTGSFQTGSCLNTLHKLIYFKQPFDEVGSFRYLKPIGLKPKKTALFLTKLRKKRSETTIFEPRVLSEIRHASMAKHHRSTMFFWAAANTRFGCDFVWVVVLPTWFRGACFDGTGVILVGQLRASVPFISPNHETNNSDSIPTTRNNW